MAIEVVKILLEVNVKNYFITLSIAFIEQERKHQSQYSVLYLLNRIQCVGSKYNDDFVMAKLSKKEAEQKQLQAKNGYWQNELDSLGIEPKRKTELNDEEELEKLADIIKQAMFQDYKVAYSEEGDAHKEEAQSTVTVGLGRGFKSHTIFYYPSGKIGID